jgi:hypothetical protein
MQLVRIAVAVFCIASLSEQGNAQPAKSGVERLYILNCGEGIAGDIGRWSPGVNEGKSMEFVDNCYLIKHSQGWMLWDTGVSDAIAAMPDGQTPADPKATHWRRPKTLVSELAELGLKPADIKFLAVSHAPGPHRQCRAVPGFDAVGAEREYDWPSPLGVGRFRPEQPVHSSKVTTMCSARAA